MHSVQRTNVLVQNVMDMIKIHLDVEIRGGNTFPHNKYTSIPSIIVLHERIHIILGKKRASVTKPLLVTYCDIARPYTAGPLITYIDILRICVFLSHFTYH